MLSGIERQEASLARSLDRGPLWPLVVALGLALGPLAQAQTPETASMPPIAGKVTLRCILKADGGVRDCQVEDETPAGAGLGAAAQRLSERFRTHPKGGAKGPVEGATIKIPMVFQPPTGAAKP
ncbi:TonB family protein [Caulobacter sp. CCH9-E1]|uniref:TonB family protein n=1 Tax=Caulobacter sp. CCH9-E1 TaxID=1768768 RepID=UPI0009E94E6B|nr:TonB family protein [Caulobacter sp. CCH9-E1]